MAQKPMKYRIAVSNLTLFEANSLLKKLIEIGYGVADILEDPNPTGQEDTQVSSAVGVGRDLVIGSGRGTRKGTGICIKDSNTRFNSIRAAMEWLHGQGHSVSAQGLKRAINEGTRYCGHFWGYVAPAPRPFESGSLPAPKGASANA